MTPSRAQGSTVRVGAVVEAPEYRSSGAFRVFLDSEYCTARRIDWIVHTITSFSKLCGHSSSRGNEYLTAVWIVPQAEPELKLGRLPWSGGRSFELTLVIQECEVVRPCSHLTVGG